MNKYDYLANDNDRINNEILKKISGETGRKEFFELPLENSALIVIDMQNYFLSNESGAFIPASRHTILPINSLIQLYQNLEMPIIFTMQTNDERNAKQMMKWWKRLIQPDSELSEIYPEMMSEHSKLIIKHQYDSFYDTDLDQFLKDNRITNLMLTGVMTNLCLDTTARSAFVRGFEVIIPVDCCAAYNYDLHFASLLNLGYGVATLCLSNQIMNK